jgi:ubiquinone/menaquinone biosynthesis C-methylase UbiE
VTISPARARARADGRGVLMRLVLRSLQWALDRMLAVGYGVVYDCIFEQFRPYQGLKAEVLDAVAKDVPEGASPRDCHVLDLACGPGNFSLALADAGFSVVGVDAYDSLVTLAQEKRRARRLPNLAFTHGDPARLELFGPDSFDQLINVHFLYAHPAPMDVLRQGFRALKPGGQAVVVNFTRRVQAWQTFREIHARRGFRAAFHSLLWAVPNTIFETLRRPSGPHYWDEAEFSARLREVGFQVLELRRTFVQGASLFVRARKPCR